MVASMPFISGLKLSEAFYKQVVWPLLSAEGYSELPHSAGLLDAGSEVFGCDDQRSTDHHWGPRILIFLKQTDHDSLAIKLVELLREKLPPKFMGYATNFSKPDEMGVQLLQPVDEGPINHRVEFLTVSSFFQKWLADWDPVHQEATLDHWRRFPQQALYAIRNGRLFRDELEIDRIRRQVRFFPKPIWLDLLIREWSRIEEEEAFVGRTGEIGDDIGSRLIACRILKSLMTITFLLEKEYWPYSKWFGTVFQQLNSATKLKPHISGALNATNWQVRERHLCMCYTNVMALHNTVQDLPAIKVEMSNFHDRPFKVPHAARIVQALKQ